MEPITGILGPPEAVNVLVVDDEPAGLTTLEAVLADPNINLVTARSGAEALRQVLERDFAVILLDVNMPGLDGYETAALIRERPRSRGTPIIFLTATQQSKVQMLRGYGVGAVDYLFTPLDPDVLRSKVAVFVELERRAALARAQAAAAAAPTAALEREVTVRTGELSISNRALRLLSDCKQALIRATSEVQLLEDVCHIVIGDRGFRSCYVVMAERDEARSLRPAAWAGPGSDLRTAGDSTWAETAGGRGPVGTAVRTGQPAVLRDLDDLAGPSGWSELRRLGVSSAAALPLEVEGRVLGAMVILADVPEAFEELGLLILAQLSKDLAFGIDALRDREAHRALAARYADVLGHMAEGACIVDFDWRYRYLNDVGAAQRRARIEELLGRTLMEAHPGIERTELFAALRRCMTGRTAESVEHRFPLEDGGVVEFAVSVTPVPEGIFVLSLDITDRRRAEHALLESYERFTAAVSGLDHVVWMASLDGSAILDVNDSFARVYGRAAADFQANPGLWLDQVHPEDRPLAEASAARLLTTGKASAEYRIVRPDGTVRWLLDRKSFICDAEGLRKRMAGVATDITEHVLAATGRAAGPARAPDVAARREAEERFLRRHAELVTLYEVTAALNRATGVGEIVDIALNSIAGLAALNVEHQGGVFLVKDGALRLVSHLGHSAEFLELHRDLKVGECLCGQVALTGDVIVSSDSSADPRHTIRYPGMIPRTLVVLPLRGRTQVLGVLYVYLAVGTEADAGTVELLRCIGRQIGAALDNARLHEEARELSLHDSLTGLGNRRLLDLLLTRHLAAAKRRAAPLSALMIDVDRFKDYNDAFGHLAGDKLLQDAAGIIAGTTRGADLAVRYGGDEFVVLLPDLDGATALDVAERLRTSIRAMTDATVSVGLCTWDGDSGAEAFLRRADEALYRAKQAGRNRVEAAAG